MFAVRGALALPSSGGRSYAERIDAVKTERQLSGVFEFSSPWCRWADTFLADRNPVRTGGPMLVSIAFAERRRSSSPILLRAARVGAARVFTRRGE